MSAPSSRLPSANADRLARLARQGDLGPAGRGGFRLNGWHVLAMFIAFFAVVVAVNVTMMRVAVSTFSGVESETPYKNGLAYNTRLEEARRQAERGWAIDASLQRGEDGVVAVTVVARDKAGKPITDLTGVVRLERPTDKKQDREATIAAAGQGRYVTTIAGIESGQWDVVVLFGEGGVTEFESRTRMVLR